MDSHPRQYAGRPQDDMAIDKKVFGASAVQGRSFAQSAQSPLAEQGQKQLLLASPIKLRTPVVPRQFKRKDLSGHRKQDIAHSQTHRRRSSRFDPITSRRKSVLSRQPSLVKTKRRSSQAITKPSPGYQLSLDSPPTGLDDYVKNDLFDGIGGVRRSKPTVVVQDHHEALTPNAFPRAPFFTFKTPLNKSPFESSANTIIPSEPLTLGPKTPGEGDDLMDLFTTMCKLREVEAAQPKTPRRRSRF